MDELQIVLICVTVCVIALGIFSYLTNYKNIKLLEVSTKDLKDIILIIGKEVNINSKSINNLADYNKALYDVLGSLKILINNVSDRLEQIEVNVEPTILIPSNELLTEDNDIITTDIEKFNRDLPKKLQLIIDYLHQYKSIDRANVQKLLQCSYSTARRYLKDLTDKYRLLYVEIDDNNHAIYKLREEN